MKDSKNSKIVVKSIHLRYKWKFSALVILSVLVKDDNSLFAIKRHIT